MITVRHATIGLLGGAGPAAAAHLHGRLIACAQEHGAEADTDFPPVIALNAGVGAMCADGFADSDQAAVAAVLQTRVAALAGAGAQVLLPGCATFTAAGLTATQMTLIDLPALAVTAALRSGAGRIGVLCSAAARRHRIYEQAADQAGAEILALTDDEQARLTALIGSLMAQPASRAHAAVLDQLTGALQDRGAQAVILGCTELSLAAGFMRAAHLDIADIAARAAINSAWGRG